MDDRQPEEEERYFYSSVSSRRVHLYPSQRSVTQETFEGNRIRNRAIFTKHMTNILLDGRRKENRQVRQESMEWLRDAIRKCERREL